MNVKKRSLKAGLPKKRSTKRANPTRFTFAHFLFIMVYADEVTVVLFFLFAQIVGNLLNYVYD